MRDASSTDPAGGADWVDEATSHLTAVLTALHQDHRDTPFTAMAIELDTAAESREDCGRLRIAVCTTDADPKNTHVDDWPHTDVQGLVPDLPDWSERAHRYAARLWDGEPDSADEAMDRLQGALEGVARAVVRLQANGALRARGFVEEPVLAVYAPGELEEEDLPSRWIRHAAT